MVTEDFWGQSLHINLHSCSKKKFNKPGLEEFCNSLCKEIDMKPYGEPMVEKFGSGDLLGHSALQFIETSNISVHTDDVFNRVFIDIFSCKSFDNSKAEAFSKEFFSAKESNSKVLNRF